MGVSNKQRAIVIGTSAGGLYALTALLSPLPKDFAIPLLIVQHRAKDQRHLLEDILKQKCRIAIKQADEKEPIAPHNVYIAPPDYHMLVERDFTISLSSDPLVSYSRPSIDVLFESAAIAYREGLTGIVLTGANSDGTAGLMAIKKNGGRTIAQSPGEAQYPYMPQAAIDKGAAMEALTIDEMLALFKTMTA